MSAEYRLSVSDMDGVVLGEQIFKNLPIRIGRSFLNDLVIGHSIVSEFHARIERVDEQLCVRDLGSKNGVFLVLPGGKNDRVFEQQPVPLGEGKSLRVILLSPVLKVVLEERPEEEAEASRYSGARGEVLGNVGRIDIPPEAQAAEDEATAYGCPSVGEESFEEVTHSPRAPSRSSESEGPVSSLPALPGRPVSAIGTVEPPPILRASAWGVQPGVSMAKSSDNSPMGASLGRGTRVEPSLRAQTVHGMVDQSRLQSQAVEAEPSRGERSTGFRNETSLEYLALQGLRELGASLVPGLPIEQPVDVVQLITKLHDAVEMFCTCYASTIESAQRNGTAVALQSEQQLRLAGRSIAYRVAASGRNAPDVAAALLHWRDPDQEIPLAIASSQADLLQGQVATIDGALAGTMRLLSELSPEAIEGDSRVAKKSLFGSRSKAWWMEYKNRYQLMVREPLAQARLFGGVFGELYCKFLKKRGGGRHP